MRARGSQYISTCMQEERKLDKYWLRYSPGRYSTSKTEKTVCWWQMTLKSRSKVRVAHPKVYAYEIAQDWPIWPTRHKSDTNFPSYAAYKARKHHSEQLLLPLDLSIVWSTCMSIIWIPDPSFSCCKKSNLFPSLVLIPLARNCSFDSIWFSSLLALD